jgi:FKBP-type peptidyl-prolyl cis-trans isomerase SlyD
MEITLDAIVTADYRFTDESGELVDSSDNNGPMTYLHGRARVLPAIEAALAGQSAGYKTSLTLQPEQAFGAHRPELVFDAIRENLPSNVDLKPGMPLFSGSGDRPAFQLRVIELTERGALLDGNHPLAGKTLRVDLEVLDVRQATAEEIRRGRALVETP